MDEDSKGQRKMEDWRRAASCSGTTQPGIEKKRREGNAASDSMTDGRCRTMLTTCAPLR